MSVTSRSDVVGSTGANNRGMPCSTGYFRCLPALLQPSSTSTRGSPVIGHCRMSAQSRKADCTARVYDWVVDNSMAFRPHSRFATLLDAWMSDAADELTRAPELMSFLQPAQRREALDLKAQYATNGRASCVPLPARFVFVRVRATNVWDISMLMAPLRTQLIRCKRHRQ